MLNAKDTQSWEKLSEELVYNGYRKVTRKHFKLPNGSEVDYETLGGGQIVCMLAVTIDKQIILAKQFRTGPEKVFAELPGGGVDANEAPEAAALRELEEETGYTGRIEFVCTTPADGYSSSTRHHFVVTECRKVAEPIADPDNTTATVVLIPLTEFREHLRSGELTDIATGYLALDHLHLL